MVLHWLTNPDAFLGKSQEGAIELMEKIRLAVLKHRRNSYIAVQVTHSMDLFSLAKDCADHIISHKEEEFTLVTHMDADGISSCAIMSTALDRAGIEHTFHCIKLNDIATITPSDNMIFCDLGSGQQDELSSLFPSSNVTIVDHHQFESSNFHYHFNPFLTGHDGGSEISGSGMTYLLSRAMDPRNVDLCPLAVVGAVGDVQNLWGRLEGLNSIIVDEGVEAGVVEREPDLRLYGRFTRPLFKSLQYFSDPPIPGVSGSESGSIALLTSLGIDVRDETWKTLSDLTFEQKQSLGTEMVQRILCSLPSEFISLAPKLIFGESYTFVGEERYSPLRDASEFSTCLNAAGRHGEPDVGVKVAKGNRGIYYEKLMSLLKRHRRMLAKGIELVESRGIEQGCHIQHFDGSGISDTLVGTIAGMVLGTKGCDPFRPLIAYTPADDRTYKVSVRCSKLLVGKDINMGTILRDVSRKYGGAGGGHAFACGAFIPIESIDPFLSDISALVGKALT